jgi:hypothetical protein
MNMGEIQTASDVFRGQQAITTSWYGCGGDSALIHHLHLQWDNAFAGVFTFETSDFPEVSAIVAPVTPGDWVPECAFTVASVVGAATVASSAATPGTPASVTVAAGQQGGCSLNFSSNGAHRMRVKVVCTATGVIRIHQHGKF